MTTQSQIKPAGRMPLRIVRSHVIGLLGANLAIGALFVWGIPLFVAYWEDPESFDWTLVRILTPWSAVESSVTVSLLYGALALAAIVAGTLLIIRAARLMAEEDN